MPRRKKNVRNDDGLASGGVNSVSGNNSSDRKYSHRPVQSHRGKYKSENVLNESSKERKPSDFKDLMSSPSDCNYFQFKSEKQWEKEANKSTFRGHEFFNLDLEVLSQGLACLPFYERVGVDKGKFSQSDIDRCDQKAFESRVRYKKVKERFLKNLQKDYELPGSVREMSGSALESKKDTHKLIHSNFFDFSSQLGNAPGSFQGTKKSPGNADYEKNVKQNKIEEENLEAWLDSMLSE